MCECHQYASHIPTPTASSTSEVTAACYLTALDQLLPLVAKLGELLSLFLFGVLDAVLSTGDSAQPHTTECCHFDACLTVTLPSSVNKGVLFSCYDVIAEKRENLLIYLSEFSFINWVCTSVCMQSEAVKC